MNPSRVQITYAGSPLFLAGDDWLEMRASIANRMPLRNLHWRSASRPSIRTVQELDVALVSLDSTNSSKRNSALLGNPLLNLYVVMCDDNDTYKTTVRKQIQDWHASINQRKNQEWLILHVLRPDSHVQGKRLFQMKGSVLDKIKADFNSDKRDRCAQVVWTKGVDDPIVWADMLSKLKEGIMSSFESHVVVREEEVRRSESQRQSPGWNFCTFCLLKDSLATSFEEMNLLEDAQIQFDELEASYFQVVKERHGSPLTVFGGLSNKDDSMPLLSVSKKPYRDFILSDSITVFDFRIYLLGRQCALLARRGDILAASQKASWFVTAFGKSLRGYESTFGKFYIESWMYSASLNIVDQSAEWSSKAQSMDSATFTRFNGVKGELLELARTQLDKIGIACGFLPSEPPFSMALSHPPRSPASTSPQNQSNPPSVTQKTLVSAIADRDMFDKLYILTTNRCIESYTASTRRRSALKMHGSLAALDLLRSRFSPALSTFSSLPAHYVGTKWVSLEGAMHARSLRVHSQMDKGRDQEWLISALALLKSFISIGSGDTQGQMVLFVADGAAKTPSDDGIRTYVQGVIEHVAECVQQLTKDFVVADHPMFSLQMGNYDARPRDDLDGSTVAIVITSRLPCSFTIDEVRLSFLAPDGRDPLSYTGKSITLAPGANTVDLFCPSTATGLHAADLLALSISKLILQYPLKTPSTVSLTTKMPRLLTVKVHADSRALDATIAFPHTIEFGVPPRLLFTINSGRNRVSSMTMTMTSSSNQVTFIPKQASIHEGDVAAFDCSADSIIVKGLKADSKISILVPFDGSLQGSPVPIALRVTYFTEDEPTVERVLRREKRLSGALPVVVNVQDFFRGKGLLSRFTVSSDGQQYVRIMSAAVTGAKETLEIKGSGVDAGKGRYITPAQPLNFIFRLTPLSGSSFENPDNLRFVLGYRTMDEELETLLQHAVNAHFSSTVSDTRKRWFIDTIFKALVLDREWKEVYANTGKIFPPRFPGSGHVELLDSTWDWAHRLPASGVSRNELGRPLGQGAEWDMVIDALEKIGETLSAGPDPVLEAQEDVRELILPLELPNVNILNAVSMEILTKGPIYAGQPVRCALIVSSTFHSLWKSSDAIAQYRMRYEVLGSEMTSWLVSGRSRDEFVVKDGSSHRTELTLIPLRHGIMALPSVSIQPVHPAEGTDPRPACESHQEHAAVRATILPRSAQATYLLPLPFHQERYYQESEIGTPV